MDQDYDVRPAAAPATRRGFGPGILGAVAAAALAIGFGAGWLSHTTNSTTSKPSGATTSVHGMLQLRDGNYSSVGNTCSGNGGYQDISGGVAVTIGDQTGKTLAVTSLQPGAFGGGGCQFTFAAQVPAGATLYTVTISHRGTQTFGPADVVGGFNMTLGT